MSCSPDDRGTRDGSPGAQHRGRGRGGPVQGRRGAASAAGRRFRWLIEPGHTPGREDAGRRRGEVANAGGGQECPRGIEGCGLGRADDRRGGKPLVPPAGRGLHAGRGGGGGLRRCPDGGGSGLGLPRAAAAGLGVAAAALAVAGVVVAAVGAPRLDGRRRYFPPAESARDDAGQQKPADDRAALRSGDAANHLDRILLRTNCWEVQKVPRHHLYRGKQGQPSPRILPRPAYASCPSEVLKSRRPFAPDNARRGDAFGRCRRLPP